MKLCIRTMDFIILSLKLLNITYFYLTHLYNFLETHDDDELQFCLFSPRYCCLPLGRQHTILDVASVLTRA